MNLTIRYNKVPFSVEFTHTPYRAANDKRPAEGGEVEIESIELEGWDITDSLSDAAYNTIKERAEQWVANNRS